MKNYAISITALFCSMLIIAAQPNNCTEEYNRGYQQAIDDIEQGVIFIDENGIISTDTTTY